MALAEKNLVKTTEVQELMKFSKNPDELTRVSAIARLAKYGSSEVIPTIIGALKDPSVNVRISALNSLKDTRDVRAVPALMDALKEKSAAISDAISDSSKFFSLRCMAADALGAIGDNKAVPALIEMAEHDVLIQQFYAAKALGQIGDPAGIPVIKKVADRLKEFPVLANQLHKLLPDSAKAIPRKVE